jgi:hypothetical protein
MSEGQIKRKSKEHRNDYDCKINANGTGNKQNKPEEMMILYMKNTGRTSDQIVTKNVNVRRPEV